MHRNPLKDKSTLAFMLDTFDDEDHTLWQVFHKYWLLNIIILPHPFQLISPTLLKKLLYSRYILYSLVLLTLSTNFYFFHTFKSLPSCWQECLINFQYSKQGCQVPLICTWTIVLTFDRLWYCLFVCIPLFTVKLNV